MIEKEPSKLDQEIAIPNRKVGKRNARYGLFYQISAAIGVAFLLATIFSAWTPGQIKQMPLMIDNTITVYQPTNTTPILEASNSPPHQVPPVIGIVAGHWQNDTGAVCPDGLTEVDVNLNIASIVQKKLVDNGYKVDLLSEFDERLDGYQAIALVSIHADSCNFINNQATGYKVASAMATHSQLEEAARLTSCLRQRYGQATNLPVHSTSVTLDMTRYHAFGEISDITPAAIIETGFLNLDRELLTQQPDIVAQGIIDGIMCYILNESVIPPTSTSNQITPTTISTVQSDEVP
jgi:N-acetylmuramoyl-L-alanine amidase